MEFITPAEAALIDWTRSKYPEVYAAATRQVLGQLGAAEWLGPLIGAIGSLGTQLIQRKADKDILAAQIKLANAQRAQAEAFAPSSPFGSLPTWLPWAAAAGVALFMFMQKSGRRR